MRALEVVPDGDLVLGLDDRVVHLGLIDLADDVKCMIVGHTSESPGDVGESFSVGRARPARLAVTALESRVIDSRAFSLQLAEFLTKPAENP